MQDVIFFGLDVKGRESPPLKCEQGGKPHTILGLLPRTRAGSTRLAKKQNLTDKYKYDIILL